MASIVEAWVTSRVNPAIWKRLNSTNGKRW